MNDINPVAGYTLIKAKSSRKVRLSVIGAAMIASGVIPANADSLSDILTGGQLSLQMRPRYEFVQQDGKAYNANALTMRTMLGYSIKPRSDFGATLQFINVSNLDGQKHYNDTGNGLIAYPVIADPSLSAINQAVISYAGIPGTALKFGRQIIVLDNSRFVGNVDFRQNMQTFDGSSLENRSLPHTTLFAAHITHVKGSYANYQIPVGSNLQPVRVDLLHADFSPVTGLDLVGYDYFYQDLSVLDSSANNISNSTAGLRLHGASPISERAKLLYTAEYAKQRGYAGGRAGIDARYLHFGGGVGFGSLYARLDYELLGSNATGTYGLQTPLATKHSFNGWVDMFLVTPGKGLKDEYVTVGGSASKLNLVASYHDYHADYDSTHYGTEWNLSAVYPLEKQLTVSVIYAGYTAKDGVGANYPGTLVPNVDTKKTWLMLDYRY